MEMEEQTMELKEPYDLIVTIVNRGHSDLVMTAAKQLAPPEGTLLHGWVGFEGWRNFSASPSNGERSSSHFWHPKKKPQIWKPHYSGSRVKYVGRGICFSPVNAALGLVSQV